jgi:hypothetical protein
MLEPVALHRAGASFRVPGLHQDGRGIVVGSEAAILVHSQAQLVALLRLLSTQTALAELLPTLRCEEVRGAIGSQGYLLRLRCSESRSLDLCVRAATFAGGLLVVGSGRHLVQYRDAAAPLGYDALSLYSHSDGDYVIYAATSVLAYSRIAELSLRQLLAGQPLLARRGSLANALHDHDRRNSLWLLLPGALLPRILRYLWGRSIAAAAMLPDPGATTGVGDRSQVSAQGLVLLRVDGGLAGSPGALLGLPGLRWLLPLSEHLAVEIGYQHPIDLVTFGGLFPSRERHLFLAEPGGLLTLPASTFVPIERLVQLSEITLRESPPPIGPIDSISPIDPKQPSTSPPPAASAPSTVGPLVRMPLRLALEATLARAAAATIVAWRQLGRLAGLLYALPMGALASLRAIRLEEGLLIIGDLAYLPIGDLYYEAAPQILVPLGLAVVPRLSAEFLRAQISNNSEQWYLLQAGANPVGRSAAESDLPLSVRALPAAGLQPLGRLLVGLDEAQLRQELLHDPPLAIGDEAPYAVYPSLGLLWPLWGGPRPLSEPASLPPARVEKTDETGQ